ncbi:MAG TPA: fibronectin type III domain-containing protein [Gemmatimonadaceae bacterium]|nr:fibronectin type III domain-containing protein [Gemmatimonadaceae bacterium]
MSDFYLILTPVLTLLIVALVGFVGCDIVFGLDRVDDPMYPRNLQLTPDNMRIDLTWEHPSNGIPDSYKVERGDQPNSFPLDRDVGLDTSFSDTLDIVNGMTYYYRIAAFKDGGVSGYSEEKMVVAGYTGLTALVTGITIGSLRSDFTGVVGMGFQVAAAPLTVSRLGRFKAPGNSRTHVVKLVDAATMADVPGGSVTVDMSSTPTAMAFVYVDLPAPVTLSAGAEYFLISQEETGMDDWFDSNTKVLTTNVVTRVFAVNGDGAGTFNRAPINEFVYGPLDLQY